MNKFEKNEIKHVEQFLLTEMEINENRTDKNEMLSRGLVLDRVFKVLKYYDELTPVLNKALDEIHYKEKWRKEL